MIARTLLASALTPVLAIGIAVGCNAIDPPPAKGLVACEARGPAHYRDRGGLEVDSAYHVAHGERPTCGAGGRQSHRAEDKHRDDGRKFRHCRKAWYC